MARVSDETAFRPGGEDLRAHCPLRRRYRQLSGRIDRRRNQRTFRVPSTCSIDSAQTMRYGENPHQKAAFYTEREQRGSQLSPPRANCRARNSPTTTSPTPMRRWNASSSSTRPRLRHRQARQPLRRSRGAATLLEAYERAFSTDPESAFGGIIAFNRELDAETAGTSSSGSSSK